MRCFEDESITYITSETQNENIKVDPLRDIETIQIELILADIQQLENMKGRISGRSSITQKLGKQLEVVEKTVAVLQEGKRPTEIELEEAEWEVFKTFNLLTLKPVLYVCNVGEENAEEGNSLSEKVVGKFGEENSVVVSAKLGNKESIILYLVYPHLFFKKECDLANLTNENQKKEFRDMYNLKRNAMSEISSKCMKLLQKIVFYTTGPEQSRAWPIQKGTTAKKAAGVIHSDFESGFICMDQLSFQDCLKFPSFEAAKNKVKQQPASYVVEDGDVVIFKFKPK